MDFAYVTHGICLALPFRCDELGAPGGDLVADIRVAAGEVPRSLASAVLRQDMYDLAPAAMLLRGGARSARFLAENGSTISFQKNAQCEEALFVHQLLYPVMAGTLWQRGLCVLHASSVVSSRGAVLVTGQSGAGKSTVVARLLADGWLLQTDDVSALAAGPGGALEVRPGARCIFLDEKSCVRLGFDTSGLERRDWQRMKMAVPAPVAEMRMSLPVERIVFLQRADDFSVRTVRGRDKIALLLQAIYGPVLPDVIAKLDELLGRLLRQTEMIAIARPPDRWTLEEIVGAIRDG